MLNLKWENLTDVIDKAVKDGANDKTIVTVVIQVAGHDKYTQKIRFKDLKPVMWKMKDYPFNVAQLTISIDGKTILDYVGSMADTKSSSKSRPKDVETRPIGTSPMIQEWKSLTARKRATIIEGLCKQIQRET